LYPNKTILVEQHNTNSTFSELIDGDVFIERNKSAFVIDNNSGYSRGIYLKLLNKSEMNDTQMPENSPQGVEN